jgi:hypothetical protein
LLHCRTPAQALEKLRDACRRRGCEELGARRLPVEREQRCRNVNADALRGA